MSEEQKTVELNVTEQELTDVMKVLKRFIIEDSYGNREGRKNVISVLVQLEAVREV